MPDTGQGALGVEGHEREGRGGGGDDEAAGALAKRNLGDDVVDPNNSDDDDVATSDEKWDASRSRSEILRLQAPSGGYGLNLKTVCLRGICEKSRVVFLAAGHRDKAPKVTHSPMLNPSNSRT